MSSLNKIKTNLQFICQHIIRAPVKSIFIIGVALIFIFALGVLHESIKHFELEVDRLYDTTVITGEIKKVNPMEFAFNNSMNEDILHSTVDRLLTLSVFQRYYTEAAFAWYFVIPPDENGNFPSWQGENYWTGFYERITTYYNELFGNNSGWQFRVSPLLATNDLEMLIREHRKDNNISVSALDIISSIYDSNIPDFLEISFAPEFGKEDFIYNYRTLENPVPVILGEHTLEYLELNVGETAFFGRPHNPNRPFTNGSRDEQYPIIIIGSHNGGISYFNGQSTVLLPIPALELIRRERLGYITFHFEIDTALNRDIDNVRNEIQAVVQSRVQNEAMAMSVILQDEELRVVVGAMERNLSLLQLMYPVAIALSITIGAGFAVLLILQNAKNAAIMRILGYTKIHTRAMFCLEHVVLVLFGIIIGLIIMPLFNIPFVAELSFLALLYLLGAIIGSVIGAAIITMRAPLDLLQVRE